MGRRFLIFALAALLLSSCGPSQYFYSGATYADLSEGMVLLGPTSTIIYLDQDNKSAYDDSLSTISEELIAKLTPELGVPAKDRIPLDDDQEEEAIAFMNFLKSRNANIRGDIPISSDLDSLIEASGYRYGLLVVADGMLRNRKGLAKQTAVNILIGVVVAIVTLGTVVPIVYAQPDSTSAYIAVLDSYSDRIVFFNAQGPWEQSPVGESDVTRILKQLYKPLLSSE